MTSTRLARDLQRVSMIATVALGVLALQASAWGQRPEPPAAPAAAPQTAAPAAQAAAPATPAPAAQPAAPTAAPTAGEMQVPPPPSEQAPIPAPPPGGRPAPGYGPPPGMPYHYYYNQPGYPGYAQPLRPVTYRPFSFGVGLGMGTLTYDGASMTKHEAALSYSIRLGFSITARWMAMLAMDGSWGQFTFKDGEARSYGKLSIAVTSYTAGVQFFMLRWLYARVGVGLACLEWSDDYGDWSDCHGQTAVGAVGAEFLQTHSTAVAVELGGFVSRFPDAMTVSDRNDLWYHVGASLVLSLF